MNNIKILVGEGGKEFGFYATWEGRRYLRFCYSRYIEIRRNPEDGARMTAHGKVAEAVAESEEQVRSTAQALKRWCEDLQADIWANDSTKSARVARRIEALISSETSIAQLLSDKASGILANDFSGALTSFFFPSSQPYERALSKQAHKRLAGIHTVWTYSGDNDRYRDYYYASPVHRFTSPHENLPVLVVHEFSLRHVGSRHLIFDRRSGFAIYGENGTVFNYLINYRNPVERWVEIYTPDDQPTDAPSLTSQDRRYDVKTFALAQAGAVGAQNKAKTMASGVGHHDVRRILVCQANDDIKEATKEIIAESTWDIML